MDYLEELLESIKKRCRVITTVNEMHNYSVLDSRRNRLMLFD